MKMKVSLVAIAAVFALGAAPHATTYTVGSGGYTTLTAAWNVAKANTSGDHTIQIVDSASYNEYVVQTGGGTTGTSITIEAAVGQTPKIYSFYLDYFSTAVTFQGLTFDGNLRPVTDVNA